MPWKGLGTDNAQSSTLLLWNSSWVYFYFTPSVMPLSHGIPIVQGVTGWNLAFGVSTLLVFL